MTTTRERRLAKAERLREWAEKRDAKSAAAHEASREATAGIPFGQPILVGHHSERRHRAAVERGRNKATQALEHGRTAARMAERADNIEAAADRAIYDDDPDAVERLREKIAALEAQREARKAYNASCRKAAKSGGVGDTSLLVAADRGSLESLARIGYLRAGGALPAYSTTNLTGNIGRLRKRLARLESNGGKPPDRIITAKYAGACSSCDAPLERGQQTRYNRADGARCVECEGADASADVDGADGRESGAGGGDALPPDDRPAEMFDGDDGQQRTITSVGARYTTPERRGQVLAEIAGLKWQTMPEGGTLSVGFMPGEGIKAAIRELRLPKVSAIAIGGLEFHEGDEGEYPGLYGIEANYANGRVRVYVIDNGCEILPTVADFWPAAT